MDDRIPLDRTVLAQEVEAAARPAAPRARRTRPTKPPTRRATSCAIPWTRCCCLCAAPWKTATITSARWWRRLSYYTVDLAWGWVAVLYLLLAYAALPVQGAVMSPPVRRAAGAARRRRSAACWPWPDAFCGHPPITTRCTACRGGTSYPVLPLLLLTCLPPPSGRRA